jgi:hypothetical protein
MRLEAGESLLSPPPSLFFIVLFAMKRQVINVKFRLSLLLLGILPLHLSISDDMGCGRR